MNAIKKIKQSLFAVALMVPLGGFSQTHNFENTCSNYSNSFALGCIPNWISTSGTPDTYGTSPGWTAPQGTRYAHMYARWYGSCLNPQNSEVIALNYSFQAGKTYRITYKAIGTGANVQISSKSTDWILTNGLINKSGGACTANEITPAIPAGSQTVASPTYTYNAWTQNQHTFTANANYSQLWFRFAITSTIMNYNVTADMALDAFTIEEVCIPTPAISGLSSFCEGSAISFNGSVSNGCTVTNNVWTVVESDQFGTPVAGATEWWSPWATGNPGTLNIPSVANGGPAMTCGKYYRIKLALQNAYTTWAETTKIIYINCPPAIKLKGSSGQICTGDVATIVPQVTNGGGAPHYVTITPISPAGAAVYSGPLASVNVTPSVTTTYQITITNQTTGCVASVNHTITVINNDPAFSLNVNTTNPSYFTLGLTANDPNGYNNSGFYYELIIEELNTTTNPFTAYYQNYGTDAWWNYPSVVETFKGYVSTGTGTFTQTPWGVYNVPAGQFLYNHTYRITRSVWNDQCPKKSFSVIVAPTKAGNGVEVYEDPKGPQSLELALMNRDQENSVEIFPNPSTGLYTIELDESNGAFIEVYNLLGKKVQDVKQTGASTTFDLTGFPKGVYFVKVTTDGEQLSKKIILE